MSSVHLKVSSRAGLGKEESKRLRATGRVPGVIYGHKEAPVTIAVDAHEMGLLLNHGAKRAMIVLHEEGGVNETAIIKEVVRHPYKGTLQSIDFLRVGRNEKVAMTVPIQLEGTPDSVRIEGGILVQSLLELHIEARPVDVPDHITVDVSGLVFNGAPIHVSELKLPQGVVATNAPDTAVAVVNPPTVEEVEAETPLSSEEADAQAEAGEAVPAEHGAATTGGEAGDDSRSGTRDGKD
jgi:large subunit ribosomal protein L25